MRFRKFIALFLSIIMLMSFSTMFVSAATPRVIDYPKTWVNVGETLQLSLPSGATNATWSSSSNAIATVSSTGKVTGVSRGENLKISVRYTLNGSTVDDELYINVYDNRGIVNGEEYYIMNVSNSKVLSLASSSTANNTIINTSARGTSTTKQWKLTQQSTGKYTFVSMYNSTTKGMYANTSTNDVYLYTVGSSATHFEIERVNSGTYQGTYRIRYNTKYLAANSSNDVYLTSTLSSKCYWSLSRVDKGNAKIMSFYYPDEDYSSGYFNTTANDTLFENNFDSYGYNAYIHENLYASTAYDYLSLVDIYAFHGHGGPGRIAFHDVYGEVTGRIIANDSVWEAPTHYSVEELTGQNSLAKLRCVLYIGCNTGTPINGVNLVTTTYNEGAHFVLGTTKVMYISDNNRWLGYFFNRIDEGYNINAAIEYANNQAGGMYCSYTKDGTEVTEWFNEFPSFYIGDGYQYLN